MKTAEEIYQKMKGEMPFDINNGPKPYIIEAMKLYAQEKVKEALQLAAERAEALVEQDFGLVYVDKQSILSLSEELINKINKEI